MVVFFSFPLFFTADSSLRYTIDNFNQYYISVETIYSGITFDSPSSSYQIQMKLSYLFDKFNFILVKSNAPLEP